MKSDKRVDIAVGRRSASVNWSPDPGARVYSLVGCGKCRRLQFLEVGELRGGKKIKFLKSTE
jgi:hypothetical protein